MKKLIKLIKDNYTIFIFLGLIILSIFNFEYMLNSSNKNKTLYNDGVERTVGLDSYYLQFSQDIQTITQTFIAQDNNLSKIDIYIDNVEDQKSSYLVGNIIVGLKDSENNFIAEYDYSVLQFFRSKTISFSFPKIEDSKGKIYTLYIKHLNDHTTSDVTFIADVITETRVSMGPMTINGEMVEENLFMIPAYETNPYGNIVLAIVSIITIIIVGIIILINKYKKIKLEKVYILAALVVAVSSVLLLPLFGGRDEAAHWARAYEISTGQMLSGMKDGWPTSTLPRSIFEVSVGENDGFLESWDNTKIEYSDDKTIDYDMQYMSVYSPVSYIPHSLGIAIARIFTNRPAIWAYTARLFNAIACITLLALAIKVIPFGKKIVFAIGLLPTTIDAISTLSADGLLISATVLMISYILNIIYTRNKETTTKDYIILALLAVVISLSKLVYLPILLLLLLLLNKEDNKKKKIIIISIIAGGFLINLIWGGIAFKYLAAGQGLNSEYYISNILTHPIKFIQQFTYTWYINGGKYLSDMFSDNNSWFGSLIEDVSIVPIIFMFITLYLALFDKEKKRELTKWQKIIIWLVIICIIGLVSVSLHITCTPIGFVYFAGIQGRYFIPILLPVLVLINCSKKVKKNEVNNELILSILIFACFLNILYSIMMYL